jgi:aryl-alcohol dehydrogenase-like predicted oxidoreductase
MRTRPCGSSDLALPVLGNGCWAFGGGAYWGAQRQADVDAVAAAALDRGVTYFDTAEAYNDGASETSLGLALRGKRARALIGTKFGPHNAAPARLRASCEASLARLGTDHVDLYMLHWPINASALRHYTTDPELLTAPARLEDAVATLQALVKEGKVRHFGVSNFGVRQIGELAALGARPAVNQLPYSLLSRGIELEILPACRSQGIGTIGYMALMQGLLSGKFTSIDALPSARTRTRHFAGTRAGSRHGGPGFEAETRQALLDLQAIAGDLGVPMAELAVAWSIATGAVTCTLVGCRDVAQLEENARAAELVVPPEIQERLDAATVLLRDRLGATVDYFQGVGESRTY